MEQALKVALSQINNSFSDQFYLPYAAGALEAYVRQRAIAPERFTFLPPVYKRQPVEQIVAQMAEADVRGFSVYVWNINISLEAARRLKQQDPDKLIVFGGPHVPDNPETFLRDHPFVDLVVHGEGEQTFLEILEAATDESAWRGIEGIGFMGSDGALVQTPRRPRMRDLASMPSPFLEGVFDPIMAAEKDAGWIGLWETNRGCPFQCTYCDWGSAVAAKVTKFSMERLKAEAEWFSRNRIEFIFCCDANFGILPRDADLARIVAALKADSGYPGALSVQNTKNATERAYETQKILSDSGLSKGVALSMQSINQGALENIKRDNISLDSYFDLQHRFTEDGVETFSDLILGLPGETYDSYVQGIDHLISNGQHNRIQFNNLTILPNAEMADPTYRARHGLKTVWNEIINIHGSRETFPDDVPESQETVIATASLPEADWRRARALSWMSAFLYFDKLLQFPLMVAHVRHGQAYGALFEAFMSADGARFPLLREIADFFLDEASVIQAGGAEFHYSAKWLGIHWPADEFIYLRLTAEDQMDAFYEEAAGMLSWLCDDPAEGALADALAYNRALISHPFLEHDLTLDLTFDLPAFIGAYRQGRVEPINKKPVRVTVRRTDRSWPDFDSWAREVVWWGNKKGDYLYRDQGQVG
ncbi:B12-binding domain-containing radical SAM protein [Magnetospira sp. QH-2]|uniref:B12-binding domain-containing radical SAM protein n=1 Tax=Magnetospira sp. (strain QH-2) TaxID=1288970 RepID=UPI0003E80A73|nr:radical SAM protein [Magnetospira sp. QH-2]CCQ73094.1 conserved protein of unknown function [Magnetospira sp. QH-2]